MDKLIEETITLLEDLEIKELQEDNDRLNNTVQQMIANDHIFAICEEEYLTERQTD